MARKAVVAPADARRYAWFVILADLRQKFLVLAVSADEAARGARKAAREKYGVRWDDGDIEKIERIAEVDAEVP
jgi:hypothetical protein